jgi:CheY-like chemotaxis protein/nitrogen-specific signal transduction histidine kinase
MSINDPKSESNLDSAADKTQEQLRNDNLVKQAALESKSRLIDNMAYQIRTLSNAIIGFSDLLNAENLPEGLQEYVDEINQAGKALSVLVNDVLDMAKLDTGNLVVSRTYCDMAESLEDLYEKMAPTAAKKHIDFSIVADPTVPSRIFTDSERMVKCLINLTTNALKYTSQGFVRISVSLQNQQNTPWIRFDIQDSGEGIDSETLAAIFDMVVNKEDANRRVLSSLDMGLSITSSLPVIKRLVDALGGRLEATSQPGQGSTFSLLMPAGVDTATEKHLDLSRVCWNVKQPSSAKASPRKSSATDSSPRILLVEDQESNRTVLTLLLETLGLTVNTAEDGVQAVEQAANNTFDLILMDLMLPNMNGYEATRILRQKNVTIPIIALSAGVMSQDDSKRIEQDFNALLTKPVDSKKLQQTLRKFLPQLNDETAAQQTEINTEDGFVIEYSNG